MSKLKVRLRGGFSDRMGIKPENTEIQLYDFDERTRNALITATRDLYSGFKDNVFNDDVENLFLMKILADLYAQDVDVDDWYSEKRVLNIVCDTIRKDQYDDVLTVIEYLTRKFDAVDYKKRATGLYNNVFEKEFVGYRIINEIITPIMDMNELSEIKEAVESPMADVSEHLDKSLKLLSDRNTPDYANSIKESITAVERMCSLILGETATLGDALKKIEDQSISIHPAMKSAFEKLYGYTSDARGIRHSGQLDGVESTYEEAKFMLVACSAFINYLKGVWAKSQ